MDGFWMDMAERIPWRQACEKAVQDFSRRDALRFWRHAHIQEGIEQPIFDYRFEHTLAVVRLARWLAPLVGADLEISECAAWLHDCRKRLQDPLSKDLHAQEASEAVPGILTHTDFPCDKIPAVRHAIEHHVGLHLQQRLDPLETALIWDADKLSKLGAASLVHFGCISGAFQPITTSEMLRRGQLWIPKAREIAECMNTEPAQKEARRRVRFLEQHYAQLEREWREPMEVCPQ